MKTFLVNNFEISNVKSNLEFSFILMSENGDIEKEATSKIDRYKKDESINFLAQMGDLSFDDAKKAFTEIDYLARQEQRKEIRKEMDSEDFNAGDLTKMWNVSDMIAA